MYFKHSNIIKQILQWPVKMTLENNYKIEIISLQQKQLSKAQNAKLKAFWL